MMTMVISGSDGVTFPDSTTQNTTDRYGFVNRIINGAMVIDQRNAGASVTPTDGQYTLDRWTAALSQSSKYTIQQNAGSVTPPVGFKNYLGATSSSAYSVGTNDFFFIATKIEGYNIADLGWGTASAKTVTLSFQVYSSLTGTFGGALRNSGASRTYPFTYTVSSANTWTTISVTIAGDTSGTWLSTNGVGLEVDFNLGTGTTYSGTAGSWSGTNYVSATGATSVVGTNGATFYITGVQLEVGSVATPFERRPYGTELSLCQRYLPVVSSNGVSTGYLGVIYEYTSTNGVAIVPLQVIPRTFPTGITVSSVAHFDVADTAAHSITDIAFSSGTANSVAFIVTSSGLNAGWAAGFRCVSASAKILINGCEL
jgi:hypothetical protein